MKAVLEEFPGLILMPVNELPVARRRGRPSQFLKIHRRLLDNYSEGSRAKGGGSHLLVSPRKSNRVNFQYATCRMTSTIRYPSQVFTSITWENLSELIRGNRAWPLKLGPKNSRSKVFTINSVVCIDYFTPSVAFSASTAFPGKMVLPSADW
jgi:hypothetical protein